MVMQEASFTLGGLKGLKYWVTDTVPKADTLKHQYRPGSHGKAIVPSSSQFLEQTNRQFIRKLKDCVPILLCVQIGTQSFH